MASEHDLKLLHLMGTGVPLDNTRFDVVSHKVVLKDAGLLAAKIAAGAVTVQKLSDVANTNEANVTTDATTSTAMTTNATFFGVFVAPKACHIKSAYYTPVSAVTGADTDTFHLNLVNKASGAGAAEIVSKEYVSGADAVAYDANTMGAVTATAGALAALDVVVAQYEKVGSGQDAPAGFVTVLYELDDE